MFRTMVQLFLLLFVFPATCLTQASAVGNFSHNSSLDATGCPLWFIPTTPDEDVKAPCKCGDDLRGRVRCSEVLTKVKLLSGICMTFDEATNSTLAGVCPYSLNRNDTTGLFFTLPSNVSELNEFMCGPVHRQGLLCGECKEGYYPAVYSYDYACTHCKGSGYNWLLFVSLTLLPTTILFLVVMVFRVNINAPPFTALILFSQITSSPDIGRLVPSAVSSTDSSHGALLLVQLVFTYHAVWNLDFFRLFIPPYCLPGVSKTLHVLTLEYLVAFYPLLLVGLTFICIKLHDHNFRPFVILWRPFHRCLVKLRRSWDVTASVINAFATFLLLSYWKIMYTSFNLLYSIKVYSVSGNSVSSYRFFYNASLETFHGVHLPFALVAIVITLVFVVLPPIVLCLYPSRAFQACLRALGIRGLAANVGAFMDLFQGYYRHRTEGQRDWRWFCGIYFLLRIAISTIYTTLTRRAAYPYLVLLCGGALFLAAVLKPYKLAIHNYLDATVLALLTIFHHLLIFYGIQLDMPNASLWLLSLLCVVAFIPILIYKAILLWWIFKQQSIRLLFSKLRTHIINSRISRQLSSRSSTRIRRLQLEDLDRLQRFDENYHEFSGTAATTSQSPSEVNINN